MDQKLRNELRHQTLATLQRLEPLARSQGASLEPCSLVIVQSSRADIEWLIVDQNGQSLRVVPVDAQTWTGSEDIEIADGSSGLLKARCGSSKWVPAEFLERGQISGRISKADLQRVILLLERIAVGRVKSSMIQQETDQAASYRDWLRDEVRVSIEALPEASSLAGDVPKLTSASRPWNPRHWGLAASLLLAVGLAFLGGMQWSSVETARLQKALDSRSAMDVGVEGRGGDPGFGEELDALENRHQQQLAELRMEKDGEIAAQRAEISRLQEALENPPRPEVRQTLLADSPFAILSPQGIVRGAENDIAIDANADSLVLLLLVRERATEYQVVIRDDKQTVVWEAPVRKRGRWEILVQFPIQKGASGVFECQLLGGEKGQMNLLHTYVFALVP